MTNKGLIIKVDLMKFEERTKPKWFLLDLIHNRWAVYHGDNIQ